MPPVRVVQLPHRVRQEDWPHDVRLIDIPPSMVKRIAGAKQSLHQRRAELGAVPAVDDADFGQDRRRPMPVAKLVLLQQSWPITRHRDSAWPGALVVGERTRQRLLVPDKANADVASLCLCRLKPLLAAQEV